MATKDTPVNIAMLCWIGGFGNNLKGNNLLTTAKMKTHVFLNALQHGRLMLHVPAMKKGHLVRERMHTSVDLSQKKT
jgi:hypothetical protein